MKVEKVTLKALVEIKLDIFEDDVTPGNFDSFAERLEKDPLYRRKVLGENYDIQKLTEVLSEAHVRVEVKYQKDPTIESLKERLKASDYGQGKSQNEYNPEIEKRAFDLARRVESRGITLKDLMPMEEPVVVFKAAMLLAFYRKLLKKVEGKPYHEYMDLEEVFKIRDEYFK